MKGPVPLDYASTPPPRRLLAPWAKWLLIVVACVLLAAVFYVVYTIAYIASLGPYGP